MDRTDKTHVGFTLYMNSSGIFSIPNTHFGVFQPNIKK